MEMPRSVEATPGQHLSLFLSRALHGPHLYGCTTSVFMYMCAPFPCLLFPGTWTSSSHYDSNIARSRKEETDCGGKWDEMKLRSCGWRLFYFNASNEPLQSNYFISPLFHCTALLDIRPFFSIRSRATEWMNIYWFYLFEFLRFFSAISKRIYPKQMQRDVQLVYSWGVLNARLSSENGIFASLDIQFENQLGNSNTFRRARNFVSEEKKNDAVIWRMRLSKGAPSMKKVKRAKGAGRGHREDWNSQSEKWREGKCGRMRWGVGKFSVIIGEWWHWLRKKVRVLDAEALALFSSSLQRHIRLEKARESSRSPEKSMPRKIHPALIFGNACPAFSTYSEFHPTTSCR